MCCEVQQRLGVDEALRDDSERSRVYTDDEIGEI